MSNKDDIQISLNKSIGRCIDKGKYSEAIELLKKGADPNFYHQGMSLLFLATYHNSIKMVQALIKHGANANATENGAAIVIAATNGSLSMVRLLTENGADVNILHYSKEALGVASENRHLDIVKYLIKKGANINGNANGGNMTPLMLACTSNKNDEVIRYLIKSGADVNKITDKKMTALSVACYSADASMVKILLDADADINSANYHTPLLKEAAKANKDDIIKLVIKHCVDRQINIENDMKTGFLEAVRHGKRKCAELFIKEGVDPNVIVNNECALNMYSHATDIQMIESLIKLGADESKIPNNYRSPLFSAIQDHRRSNIARLFLNRGADANAEYDGKSLLSYAISQNNLEGFRLLISHGADVNKIADTPKENKMYFLTDSQNFNTALAFAAYHSAHACRLLLDLGANPNQHCNKGSPLSIAIMKGRPVVVKALVDGGADAKEIVNGKNLIMFACHSSEKRDDVSNMVQILIDAGADIHFKDSLGKTPLDYTKEFHVEEACALIEDKLLLESAVLIEPVIEELDNKPKPLRKMRL